MAGFSTDMTNRAGVIVLVMCCFGLAGIVFLFISRQRDAAFRSDCAWLLKNFAMGLENRRFKHYLQATIPNPALPPEKRLSWLIEMPIQFGEGGGIDAWWPPFDRQQAWDSEANFPVMERNLKGERQPLSGYPYFTCAANPNGEESIRRFLTDYVGLSGVGKDAATLPLTDRRAGFFGYKRLITPNDITDGLSNTAIISETMRNNGHWMEGGEATVRGLVPGDTPILGVGGQFEARHRGVNFAFADGSVRCLSTSVSTHALEALVTIAGGEKIEANDF